MRKLYLAFLLVLATAGVAAAHSVTLTWSASSTPGVSYHVYRNGVIIASVATETYLDPSLPASTTYSYEINAFCVSCLAPITGESALTAPLTVKTPADVVIPPSNFPAGTKVKTLTIANVRGTAPASGYGTLLGQEPAGATGTVTTAAQVVSSLGWTWVQVKFTTCVSTIPSCTGYVGSDNLAVVTPAPPPLTLTCVANVCTVNGGTSGETGTIEILPGGPTATWKKP